MLTLLLAPVLFRGLPQANLPTLTPIAHVRFAEIEEGSGIVKSDKYPGVYWTHNDSGDSPRIFPITAEGELVVTEGGSPDYAGIKIEGARNVDWEDISREGTNLIVSDMGNNKNKRQDLGVYIFPEPDPRHEPVVKSAVHVPISYPDQTEFPPSDQLDFDCEALFPMEGKLYFITKQRVGGKPGQLAKLYQLDTRNPESVNKLVKLDERKLDGWVTSAAVSPDGKTLAVLTQAPGQSVWFFPLTAGQAPSLLTNARRIAFSGARQCEAICWDDAKNLRITNEQGDIFRLDSTEAKPVQIN